MSVLSEKSVLTRYQRAKDRRSAWESLWQECYDYALPTRDTAVRSSSGGPRSGTGLFDGTAPDAVDQLAASLMAQLTPPWSRWFGFAAGPDVATEGPVASSRANSSANTVMQSHFDRSNFAVEMHQCYLDLVTAGTASLAVRGGAAGRAVGLPLHRRAAGAGGARRGPGRTPRRHLPPHRIHRPRSSWRAFRGAPELIEQLANKDRSGDGELQVPVIEAVVPDTAHMPTSRWLRCRTAGPQRPRHPCARPLLVLAIHQLPLAEGAGRDLRPRRR